MGDICDRFEPQECWNSLEAAGYASVSSSDGLERRAELRAPSIRKNKSYHNGIEPDG